MSDQSTVPTSPAGPAPVSGLGGWLVLLMANLGTVALDRVIGLPDIFQAFGDLSTANIDALQSNLVQIDLIASIAIYIVAPLVLLAMMLGRQRRFPRFYVRWAIVSAVFAVLDVMLWYAVNHVTMEANGDYFFGGEMVRQLLGPAIALCAWTPYLLRSQRAKNTFVK